MDQAVGNFLRNAIGIGALEFIPKGRPLKSGRLSPYFFNTGLFRDGKSLATLAEAYAYHLQLEGSENLKNVVLFGPAYKGIPLVAAIALALYKEYQLNVGYAYDRKEAKDHGEGGLIVGSPVAGKNVIVVDDVITTGTSSDGASNLVRSHGGKIVACYIAFDREERGSEDECSAVQAFEKRNGVPVTAVANFSTLIELFEAEDVPLTNTEIKTILPLLKAYRDQYGVR